MNLSNFHPLFYNQDALPLSLSSNHIAEQARRLQNNLEQALLKEKIFQLLALKDQLMQQTMGKMILKSQLQAPSGPFHALNQHDLSNSIPKFSQSPSISENNSLQTLSPVSKIVIPKLLRNENEKKKNVQIKLQTPSREELGKSEIQMKLRDMVVYLMKNFGKVKDDFIQVQRSKYQEDAKLVQVYDILVRKYSGASKSREEMIKYILRKALRAVKNTIQRKLEVDSKGASTLLCKRYFNENVTILCEQNIKLKKTAQGEDDDEDDDILKAMLPFRKNSKNKTMNANFLAELFSSDQFCKDYDLYLSQVDEILEKDNEKKIGSFLTFLENCIKKNQIEMIKNCKRLPWIQLWLDATKNLAFELATTKSWVEARKKVNTGLHSNSS